MKNTLVLFGMAGMAALGLSSFSLIQKDQDPQPKKTRHIKMIKMENGKKMELDTVVSNDAVFVWNGDTINPQKDIKGYSPSEFDKIHHPDGDNVGHKKMRIYKYKGDQPGQPGSWKVDADDDLQIFTNEKGDSTQKKIIIHRKMKDGNEEDRIIELNDMDGQNFPPMPPVPPMPHMRMMRDMHSRGMIDLNDPNIISFKKKKMSGDREKIEIIRNKSKENENMNLNFHSDDTMAVPEPPQPPDFKYEYNTDKPVRKEMRKERRIEEKKDQKTEQEVTPQETK
ncbi:MAG TPA: hypothetical protein DCL77_06090 [Prolixibacteraceae bacterium]|nr:hypothetical protein [Prolixibacteraceae bacterium]